VPRVPGRVAARADEGRVTPTVACEIDRYLATGASDPDRTAWSGDLLARARQAREALRAALVAEVRRRAPTERRLPRVADPVALARARCEPMVRGLFPNAERDVVLALVERSVVFVTSDTVEAVLRGQRWDRTAWNLANLYLGSMGAPPLGPDAVPLLGLSEETTCYVTAAYLEEEDPFADFVVHEVAHIFHNCKREHVGLPFSRRREWLLDIDFRQRETFAYACEAFARVLERARGPSDRLELAAAFGRGFRPGDDRVDAAEVADLVREASARRNGWKVILGRCAPTGSLRRF
jgi:hypothetical protein